MCCEAPGGVMMDARGSSCAHLVRLCAGRSVEVFGRFMDDIRKALPVILVCGGAVSFFLGLGYLVFLKFFAGCMVWLTVLSCFLVLVAITAPARRAFSVTLS